MKKLISLILGVFLTTTLTAQPPQNRPLPNQFRDYVDFSQQQERPKVERKDGKVVITMTEEQYKRMQMLRQRPPTMMARFQQQVPCRKCQLIHRRHGSRVKNFRR